MASNDKYEHEINKMVLFLFEKPDTLKSILRNYDELVKNTYFPNQKNNMIDLPYWCYADNVK